MKGLVFGAGNIGRGFLGLLLSKSGFNATFVEVDPGRIVALNDEKEYPVFISWENGMRSETVQGINAISAMDTASVEQAVIEADIILTAVGKQALGHIAPSLARGLIRRLKTRPTADIHVTVVACENVQDNTAYLRDLLREHVSSDDFAKMIGMISFPNCVVDRIVPNIVPQSKSRLAVAVESYFQLAIDGDGLIGPFPQIIGVDISADLSVLLEQKLCTLNMAHAIVGYYGYIRGCRFIHEAISVRDIHELLQGALLEVCVALTRRHASITPDEQMKYAAKVVNRFRNPYLQDEVIRVARQPMRKLGPDDRLLKPAILLAEQGEIPAFLASGIAAALSYDYAEDAEAQKIVSDIRDYGVDRVLERISRVPLNSALSRLVKADFHLRAL